MPGDTYNLVGRDGRKVSVPLEGLADALDAGYRVETEGEGAARAEQEGKDAQYGGARDAIAAGLYGVGRGVTLGLSDAILAGAGAEDEAAGLRREFPTLSTGTEVAGGLGAAILSGGSSLAGRAALATPAGLATRAGLGVAEKVGTGTTGRYILGTTLGGAIEGGAQGVGSYISDVALENKDLSAEAFLGSAGHGALWGGLAGGGLAGIERGTIAARRLFPRSAVGDREAVEVAEQAFAAKARDQLASGDELAQVARQSLDDIRIRNAELNLEREQLKGAKDAASRIRAKEIAVEKAKLAATRKQLLAEQNAERAAQGLPDLPEPTPQTPILDEAAPTTGPPVEPGAVSPSLAGADDLATRLAATKGLLDEGVPFADIGAAARNAEHEAGMLADDAVKSGAEAEARLADKLADYEQKAEIAAAFTDPARMSKGDVRDYIAQLKAKAGPQRYRYENTDGSRIGGGAGRKTDRVRDSFDDGIEEPGSVYDRVWAGIGRDVDAPPPVIPEPVPPAPVRRARRIDEEDLPAPTVDRPPSATGAFADEFDAAFSAIDKGSNQVHLSDLRKAMPQYSAEEFNAKLNQLRREKSVSLDSADGRQVRLTPEQVSGGLREAGSNLTLATRVSPSRGAKVKTPARPADGAAVDITAGLDNTDRFDEAARRIFRRDDASIDEIAGSFEPPPGYSLRVHRADRNGAEGTGFAELAADIIDESTGKKVGKLSRQFSDVDGQIVVTHDQIGVDKLHRGKGISDSINRNALAAYERMGVNRVEMAADEVGRYQWAKLGFRIKPDDGLLHEFTRWAQKQPALADDAKDLAAQIQKLGRKASKYTGAEKYAFLRDSIDNRLLSELDDAIAKPGALATHEFADGATGKDFLLYGSTGGPGEGGIPSGWLVEMEIPVKRGDPFYEHVRGRLKVPDAPNTTGKIRSGDVYDAGGTPVRLVAKTKKGPGGAEVTEVKAYRTLGNGEEVAAGSATFRHRGDTLSPADVTVEPALRRKGIGSKMYELAENQTGRRIIASETQTAEGKALNQAFQARRGGGARKAGAELDAEYDDLIARAAQADGPDELAKIAKQAGDLEDEIFERVAARGGRDAEQVAKIRANREQYGWTSEDVAARRAEKMAVAEPGPRPVSARAAAEDRDIAAFERTMRENQFGSGRTAGDLARELTTPPRSLADEILSVAEPPPAGRFIDDAEQAVKAIGDMEEAAYQLTKELGPAAPPAMQQHAAAYEAALDDQARKITERAAQAADDAVRATDLISLPKPLRQPALAKGAASKALDTFAMVETLNEVAGVIPGMPNARDLPVVGPLLSLYLKYRAGRAAISRLGGRIPATAEAKVAAKGAELRDKIAGIVDSLLAGTAKGARMARRPAVVGGAKLLTTLSHPLYPDGEKNEKPKSPADALKQRVRELNNAAVNPDAVKAAVRQQVQASNPDVTAAIESAVLRKLAYLHKHAPKVPPPGPFGERPWTPSQASMERFARRVRAAEDPASVIADFEAGTLTPEAAETLRVVYPQMFAEVQQRLLTKAAELNAKLPYQKMVQASLLFDAPLDASLLPQNVVALQSANESSAQAATGQTAAGPVAGQQSPPASSVAQPVRIAGLYETADVRRASRR